MGGVLESVLAGLAGPNSHNLFKVVNKNLAVVDFLPKVKIEAAISDDLVDRVIEAVEAAARTGKIGDGKIFVYNLEQVVRIRTGETGKDAL